MRTRKRGGIIVVKRWIKDSALMLKVGMTQVLGGAIRDAQLFSDGS